MGVKTHFVFHFPLDAPAEPEDANVALVEATDDTELTDEDIKFTALLSWLLDVIVVVDSDALFVTDCCWLAGVVAAALGVPAPAPDAACE